MDSISELLSQIKKRDRKSIAKAITLVESTKPEDQKLADQLLGSLPETKKTSLRIGISGPPGVGKSTFIETIGQTIISQNERLAILAVDPSSSITGGSILGTKPGWIFEQKRSDIYPPFSIGRKSWRGWSCNKRFYSNPGSGGIFRDLNRNTWSGSGRNRCP